MKTTGLRAPSFLTRLLAPMLPGVIALLQGCATTWGVPGIITTTDERPFYLSSAGQGLLIEPGRMKFTVVQGHLPFASSRLEIETGRGKLVIKLPKDALTNNTVQIFGATHGLSADIAGTWTDHPEGQYQGSTTQSCTYSGYCTQNVEVRRCFGETFTSEDRAFHKAQQHAECKATYEARYGYFSNCSGQQHFRTTMERYRRTYRVEFLDPRQKSKPLGHFEGTVGGLVRELGREAASDCRGS
ncbi:hypothetical protein [uncultured Lamprocystis sp.]|uniref:hypothetical protein n=1 Tax=uncultured Lamprocystis sp. TaxID=543132 RepID=UPI0025E41DFE|nr:hypothetical protein [uncultured Lamprocystis sp.]